MTDKMHDMVSAIADKLAALERRLNACEIHTFGAGPAAESGESSADFLKRLGDDAAKWAAAFCRIASKRGHYIDEGWMISWFANAIEHSSDVRRWRREAAEKEAPSLIERRCGTCKTYSNGMCVTTGLSCDFNTDGGGCDIWSPYT